MDNKLQKYFMIDKLNNIDKKLFILFLDNMAEGLKKAEMRNEISDPYDTYIKVNWPVGNDAFRILSDVKGNRKNLIAYVNDINQITNHST